MNKVCEGLEEQRLGDKIGEVENAFEATDPNNKAWKIVNTITNRKAAASGKLSGKDPEERKKQWYEHFNNLLGTPAEDTTLADVQPVLLNLRIIETEFAMQEALDATKQISEGKSPGEYGIMPEILKRCDIDETLEHFANKMLTYGEKPVTNLPSFELKTNPQIWELKLENICGAGQT